MDDIVDVAVNIISFAIATLFLLGYRRHETLVAVVWTGILFQLLQYNELSETQCMAIVAFGFIMSLVEIVCTKFFNIWRYNYAKNVVPLWLPPGWSMCGLMMLVMMRLA